MTTVLNKFQNKLIAFSVDSPRAVLSLMLLITFLILGLAAVPSLWPDKFPYLNHLIVDTDPENMLPHDEPARVFHEKMKKQMKYADSKKIPYVIFIGDEEMKKREQAPDESSTDQEEVV